MICAECMTNFVKKGTLAYETGFSMAVAFAIVVANSVICGRSIEKACWDFFEEAWP